MPFRINDGIFSSNGTVCVSMLIYAGYVSGASMLPVSIGGKGFNQGQAHQILSPFVAPISVAILILLLGVLLGGIGFILICKSEI